KGASDFTLPAFRGSAAALASPAFEFDDVIVGVTSREFPSDPAKIVLPDDPRNPGSGMKDYFEFQRRLTLLADKEITIRLERGPEGAKQTVDLKVPAVFHKTLGVRMRMGPITAVRENSAAANEGGVVARPAAGS